MEIKDFYEASAKKYRPEEVAVASGLRRFIAHDDRFETVVRFLKKYLSDECGQMILDVGCGDGVYEKMIGQPVIDKNIFYGLDIAQSQLEKSRAIFREVKGMDFDKDPIPYANHNFDYVICSEVLEHLFYPEKILKEIDRVLKPGGILLITTPNLGSLQNRLAIFFFGDSPSFNYLDNTEHIRFYNKKTLVTMLGDNYRLIRQIGLNGFIFERYLFPVRIIMPYLFQKIANKLCPNLGAGLFLIFRKNEK